MKERLIYILLMLSGHVTCQENLVRNHSLEKWKNHFPINWSVISASPDVIKGDVVFYPKMSNTEDKKLRDVLFGSGSQGLSYVNLVRGESIQGELSDPLTINKVYVIEFYINRLAMKSQMEFNKLSIKLSKNEAPEKMDPENVSHYIIVEIPENNNLKDHEWSVVKAEYLANGGERFLQVGYFGDLHNHHGHEKHLVHFCYDEFYVYEKVTESIHFREAEYKLSNQDKQNLNNLTSKAPKNIEYLLTGYASTKGDKLYNHRLSEKRNHEIAAYLKNMREGIQVVSQPFGEDFSVPDDSSFQRVDIMIRPTRPIESVHMGNQLHDVLSEVLNNDQRYRVMYDSLMKIDSYSNATLDRIEKTIMKYDSMNVKILESIFSKYGYPGLTLVGADLMNVGFWVMQHAPYHIRVKYKDLVMEAADRCEMNYYLLPFFIDRILLDEGKPQLYGTQVYYDKVEEKFVQFEIEDIDAVDERRALYHLEPLASYLESYNAR